MYGIHLDLSLQNIVVPQIFYSVEYKVTCNITMSSLLE